MSGSPSCSYYADWAKAFLYGLPIDLAVRERGPPCIDNVYSLHRLFRLDPGDKGTRPGAFVC